MGSFPELACMIVSVCAVSFGQGQVTTVASKDRDIRRVELPTKEEVDRVVEQREAIARRALDVLNDASRSTEARVDAARSLGRLRYDPAIPVLLRYLDVLRAQVPRPPLPVPGAGSAVVDWEGMYPCVVALAQFGTQAVPATVEAYLDRNASQHRLFLLYYSFTLARTEKEACRYILGLKGEDRDKFMRSRLPELLNDLSKE